MELVNQFGAILGIGTLLVSGFIYLYSTAKRGRQDIIRQDNADLRASNQEMRTQKAALDAIIIENRETIRQLRDIATQTPAVTKLIEMHSKTQEQTSRQHGETIKELSKLTGQISHLATEFASLAKAIKRDYERGAKP